MPAPVTVAVKVHDEAVRLKLLKAAPGILANNRLLVTSMAETAVPAVVANTPVGPGHFGYHGRDTVKVVVHQRGMKTVGQIKAAVQLYWREYGTRGRSRRFTAKGHRYHGRWISGKVTNLTLSEAGMRSAFTDGGEAATMTAHKAVGAVRRLISFYYGGMAKWWHL